MQYFEPEPDYENDPEPLAYGSQYKVIEGYLYKITTVAWEQDEINVYLKPMAYGCMTPAEHESLEVLPF